MNETPNEKHEPNENPTPNSANPSTPPGISQNHSEIELKEKTNEQAKPQIKINKSAQHQIEVKI